LVENVYQKALKMVKETGLVVRIIAGKHPFINDNNFDIGICSIGRFLNHIYPDMPGFKIDLNSLKYVVIDEADKMADTPEFPPLYRILKEKADFATMLFSATNNASVKNFIDPDNHYAFCYGTPNTVATSIVQKFWHVNSHCTSRVFGVFRAEPVVLPFQAGERPHPFDGIFCLLKKDFMNDKSVLIFVKRTALADFIAQRLTIYGLPTVSVHSNQTFEQRQRFIRFFNDGEVRIMVATNLLTRGTDLQVDYIINYDIPVEYSEYIHRCGRTGRNQKRGRAITCVDFDNHDDYCPAVLRQIALSLEDRNVPDFMAEFVENARKLHTLENED
jgi:superfamily II DNA/RNA helicase